MTRVRACVVGACLVAVAAPATAQETQGWQISVDAIHIMTRGNDVHVGDVFTEEQTEFATPSRRTLDYGVTNEPLVTEMNNRLAWLVTAGYRGERWGVGGRGWRVATTGALEGRAASPAPTIVSGPGSLFFSSAVTGVRMWDHSGFPVGNDLHQSFFSPVTYHAENELKNLRLDGYVERRWISSRDLNVSLRFGVAGARVENTRAEGHAETAVFITLDDRGTGTTADDILVTFNNAITLEAESDAAATLIGPAFGITGDTTIKRVRIDWLLGPAVLLGTAETSGTWIDIDDITEVATSAAGTSTFTELLRGELPVERRERVVVPVVDLQIKASVRLANRVRVGAGLFSSSWLNVPVAPAFSIPGAWIDVEGTGWHSRARDLTFFGYSGFVTVGF